MKRLQAVDLLNELDVFVDLRLAEFTATDVLSGTAVQFGGTGGEDLTLQTFYLDLDQRAVNDREGDPFFESQIVEVDPDRRVMVDFDARADEAFLYRWIVEIECLPEGGLPFSVYVDVNGKIYTASADVPSDAYFTLTGVADQYDLVYAIDDGGEIKRDSIRHVLPE